MIVDIDMGRFAVTHGGLCFVAQKIAGDRSKISGGMTNLAGAQRLAFSKLKESLLGQIESVVGRGAVACEEAHQRLALIPVEHFHLHGGVAAFRLGPNGTNGLHCNGSAERSGDQQPEIKE